MAGSTEALAALHQLHLNLQSVNEDLARGPRQVRVRQQRVTDAQNEVARLKDELKQTRAAGDRKSLDLKSREAKLADLRAKLNACTSNREYEVLRGQIEADEVANSVLEDEILELLEKVDSIQRQIGETETRVKELQAECQTAEQQVAQAAAGLKSQVEDLTTRIRGAESVLGGDDLARYRRLIEAHGADGMSGVNGKGICSNCFVSLTPQSQVVIRGGEIMFCSNCGRLLYSEE